MRTDEGPYFDDLAVGQRFAAAPALTLTSGLAAVHRSIVGSRLRLSLDAHLSRAATGRVLADPALVWDVAIGQSTTVTRRVVANLFYRGLAFHRLPSIDDTLSTTAEVVGLKQNSTRPSGLAVLRMVTRDQEGRLVLDFWRCAMLPLSATHVVTGHADDLAVIGDPPPPASLRALFDGWEIPALPAPITDTVGVGSRWRLTAGDVVSGAPELARTTLNLAHVHHDGYSHESGRLVYGGHTIGLALAQLTRTLPDLVTVAGWRSCDHIGPVREGDTLVSEISVETDEPITEELRALGIRVQVDAKREGSRDSVLDWRLTAVSR